MRAWPQRARKSVRIEIIPMIDVMMFLLVFFVLISINVLPALGLKVALPHSALCEVAGRHDDHVHSGGANLIFGSVSGSAKSETMGVEYVEAVNDGLALLRRRSGPRDGVLTFDEFNPFNYLLDRPSPRGGFAATAYDYVFCDAAHPDAERFFGDTRYVMVRKYTRAGQDDVERGNVLALMRLYGSTLRVHFAVVEETEHWVLWRRIDAPATAG